MSGLLLIQLFPEAFPVHVEMKGFQLVHDPFLDFHIIKLSSGRNVNTPV